jgi:hypothetical protein
MRGCHDLWIQPAVYDIYYVPQAFVADSLAVHARHAGVGVAHDMVDRNLISRFARDRLKRVPQGVEAQTPAIEF